MVVRPDADPSAPEKRMSPTKSIIVLLALAACAPAVPDSGTGVGFGDYSDYVRQRDMNGSADPGLPLGSPMGAPATSTFSTERIGAALDNAQQGNTPPLGANAADTGPVSGRVIGQSLPTPFAADRPRGDAPIGIRQEAGEMQGAAGISDEQDFDAVASRETIESDAERLANQRAQYEVIAPTALPQRSGESQAGIVQFALSTSHAPGVPMYPRGGMFSKDPLVACGKYASPDLAQEQFLAKGGPQRDREGLDPDGDGFACGWDPRPFRKALQ
jgi:hypothetical protein